MSAVDHGTLSAWLRYWDELLKEPKELVLGNEYFPNVLREAADVLEGCYLNGPNVPLQRNNKKPESVLLDMLAGFYRDGDPFIELLETDFTAEIAELRELLDAGAYNVARLYPLLQRLKGEPSTASIIKALHRELSKGAESDCAKLRTITAELLRRSLGQFGRSELKKLPKKALAQECTYVLLEGVQKEVAANDQVRAALQELSVELLTRASKLGVLEQHLDTDSQDMFGVFEDKVLWINLSYGLISHMRELWAAALNDRRQATCGSEDIVELVNRLRDEKSRLAELGLMLVERYAENFHSQTIYLATRQELDREDSLLSRTGRSLGDLLNRRDLFYNEFGMHERGSGLSSAGTLASEALERALRTQLSSVSAKYYLAEDQEFCSELASKLGGQLTELLWEEVTSAQQHQGQVTPDHNTHSTTDELQKEILAVCLRWASCRRLHSELGSLLKPLAERLLNHAKRCAASSSLQHALDEDQLWAQWAREFSSKVENPRHLAWHNVYAPRLERVLNAVQGRIEPDLDEWLVIHQVEGLVPQKLRWQMGEVTFYDPEEYDHGEDKWLLRRASEDEATTRTVVRVGASTRESAKRRARQVLDDTLSALSFGLSRDRHGPGFRPHVDDDFFVVSLSGGGWQHGESPLVRSPLPVAQRAADQDIPAISQAYNHLLSLAFHSADELNELQTGFLKAVNWYRRGLWESEPSEKFLLYWIGLEHLFDTQEGGLLEDSVPQLHVTWLSLSRELWPLFHSNREVRRKIEADPELAAKADAAPELAGWRKNLNVLLSLANVEILLNSIGDDTDNKRSLERYAEELETLASQSEDIEDYVGHLRERQRFKVYALKRLRNRIVHRAHIYEEDIELYAEELGEIFSSVLYKVGSEALSPSPDCTTLDELVDLYQLHPWASSDDY